MALTPGWPDDPETVTGARKHPEAFAGKGIGLDRKRFVFLDNDTKLLFATAFDGDWDPYIEDFATKNSGLRTGVNVATHLPRGHAARAAQGG